MAQVSKAQRQNIFRLLIVASLILGGYSINTLLVNYIFFRNAEKYPISEEGNEMSQRDVLLNEINWDYESYLDSLFNSSYFENLTLPEQQDFLSDLLGDDALDYIADSGLTPEEFLADYGDDLSGLFDSLAGGDSFDSSMLDSFPDELAAVLLARPMFYAYGSNPSNPWNDQSEPLFKIAAYNFYNTTSYNWEISDLIDNSQTLNLETADEEKWMIKYPVLASPQVSTGLPAVSPNARVMEYTPSSDPLYTPSVNLKNQIYLGGMTGEASYSEPDIGEFTNLTYNLLYDSADYNSAFYYQSLGVSMAQYTGGNLGVSECLKGPQGTINWDNYRSTNTYFGIAADELEATTAFINADNIYDKIQAVIDYVGANFVYDIQGDSRPAEGEDPIEWLSEVRESKYPFEITSLTVALARLEGLSVRYVSGYKWDDFIAMQAGSVFTDDSEGGLTAYTYVMGNSMTWLEVFIPTSTSDGDWVEFDNKFSATPSQPPQDQLDYILKFDGSYTPAVPGYDRDITPSINIEVNASFGGTPLNSLEVVMEDISYNSIIDTAYTDSNGIATFTLFLSNMVSGPHVFNFTSSYLGEQFGNGSIINIIEDVDVSINFFNPTVVDIAIDDTASLSIQGNVWDFGVSAPIKNAQILAQGVLEGGSYPADVIDFFPSPAVAVSDINGFFSLDVSLLGWGQGNYTIYTQFMGNFDISNDIQLSGIIISSHSLYADNVSNQVEFLHINPASYDFTARLDSTEFSSTLPAADITRIQSSGGSVDISVSLIRDGSTGVDGASVILTDLTNGTVFYGTTVDGEYNFTIDYGAGVNPGPHQYHISLYYDDGVVILSGSNYEDYIWVIYNNAPLTCLNSRSDWNEILAVGDTNQKITITGSLLDPNLLGYHNAELTYWIFDDGSSVIDPTGIFTVSLTWNPNSQDGDFTAEISLNGAIDPSLANYSIIIGFDGTLSSSLGYNAAVLATNATELEFTVFDKPTLTTSYVSDSGSDIIVGITRLNITGTLNYSNGTAIAGQDINIEFFNSNGDPVYAHPAISTNSTGDYEILDLLVQWDVAYYIVSYNGDVSKNLDLANPITKSLV